MTAAAPAGCAVDEGTAPLIEARGLTRHFKVGGAIARKNLHAVDDVNFTIGNREIVALVGESGSGKSTVARLLARVYNPTAGEIFYQGKPLSSLRSRRDLLAYRSDVPMVFQDPFASLNPAYRVSHGILRGLALHRPDIPKKERRAEAERIVARLGLDSAGDVLDRYPYELSGGQRQRIGFAQALAYRPRLIVADEPVSMVDASLRVAIVNLFKDLRDELKVSIIYITHDLATAYYISDRIIIMQKGEVVESGNARAVLDNPQHPYSILLKNSVLSPDVPADDTTGDDEPQTIERDRAARSY